MKKTIDMSPIHKIPRKGRLPKVPKDKFIPKSPDSNLELRLRARKVSKLTKQFQKVQLNFN